VFNPRPGGGGCGIEKKKETLWQTSKGELKYRGEVPQRPLQRKTLGPNARGGATASGGYGRGVGGGTEEKFAKYLAKRGGYVPPQCSQPKVRKRKKGKKVVEREGETAKLEGRGLSKTASSSQKGSIGAPNKSPKYGGLGTRQELASGICAAKGLRKKKLTERNGRLRSPKENRENIRQAREAKKGGSNKSEVWGCTRDLNKQGQVAKIKKSEYQNINVKRQPKKSRPEVWPCGFPKNLVVDEGT